MDDTLLYECELKLRLIRKSCLFLLKRDYFSIEKLDICYLLIITNNAVLGLNSC